MTGLSRLLCPFPNFHGGLESHTWSGQLGQLLPCSGTYFIRELAKSGEPSHQTQFGKVGKGEKSYIIFFGRA